MSHGIKVSQFLENISDNDELLEIGRKAIEDLAIEFRDRRISVLRNNGICCKEADGTDSSIIRFGPEVALRTGLKAIAKHLSENS